MMPCRPEISNIFWRAPPKRIGEQRLQNIVPCALSTYRERATALTGMKFNALFIVPMALNGAASGGAAQAAVEVAIVEPGDHREPGDVLDNQRAAA
jgi:hypothetical protein